MKAFLFSTITIKQFNNYSFTLPTMAQKIILASQSPRRKQLLEWAEVPFEIIVQPTEESFPEEMPIEEVPVYIARHKAETVKQSLNNTNRKLPILAADTIVVLNK